ncbi:MAG TPA: GNAT family N-acetyltransferase [Ktedonobacterales bacterium]|nr:GNAT family N-acetyltransferase [Ktedonobacterales bacterium]
MASTKSAAQRGAHARDQTRDQTRGQTNETLSDPNYRRDLGDGLVLRWSTAADAERLGLFYSLVFRETAESPLNQHIILWVRDMLSGRHHLIGGDGFALVENTQTGEVVAATCLINQAWDYAGVHIPVGRPEIVGSLPDYRRRGLVREVFRLIHARSAALGHLAQGITGIPYYYRQFGYEYALDLGGQRFVAMSDLPSLKADESEPYSLRDATLDDIPQLMRLYDRQRQAVGALVTAVVDEAHWRWTIDAEHGMDPAAGQNWHSLLVMDNRAPDSKPVGAVFTNDVRWDTRVPIWGAAVAPGVSLVAAAPSILRGVRAYSERMLLSKPDLAPANRIELVLGRAHPLYDALENVIPMTASEPPYAWYIRVPDLPGFLRLIAPVLERRLADSVMAGHTGALAVDFYRGGLRLLFEQGKLAQAEDWQKPVWGQPKAGFPPLVFLQLLFGYRSLAELRHAYPDVWAEDAAQTLLTILFPPQPSLVMPLE